MFKRNKKDGKAYRVRLTHKGLALIAAIETGLLPEIERDGIIGYDDELFSRFWNKYNALVEEQYQPLRKKGERRTEENEKYLK